MLIEWNGHSCFKISHKGYSIVLDPYNPTMFPRMKPYVLEANMILASHGHDDHNYRQGVTLIPTDLPDPFQIETIHSFHDDAKGNKRGPNNITILTSDSIRVAHFGDLGCFLQETQYELLKGVDAVMIPVGGHFTIDAHQAKTIIDRIKPKVVIPMHYRGENFGFPMLATVDDFLKLCNPSKIVRYETNQIEISNATKQQIAVLKYL
ncbi:MAG: MBL fold metallo-hydrolase [Bacilli bacterium]|nr:MBL fold metallo-hydrolase [Bacilli bacterium]MBN2876506.1 MBL fold metallo-hydrolase [Bacilli bacterium]